jgi:hypothetical protein
VFPEHFSRPNLHALLHLSNQARYFGSSRNLSVSTKEMVHRLHKAVVPHTNRNDIIRDLMTYQNDMHALRFTLEMAMEENSQGNYLCELARLGLFDSTYFETSEDLLARGLGFSEESVTTFHSGDDNFFGIRCHGRPWSASRISSSHPHLPRNRLSDIQLAELFKAYETLGSRAVLTNNKVSFYHAVSYLVRGRASATVDEGKEAENNSGNEEIRKVKIKSGDIIEFVDSSLDSFNGRGFGQVVAVMVHETMVFLVIKWIITTGKTHPRLHLHEFKETPLFYFAAFHPLSIVDHPRFVNRAHFGKLDGNLYLNEWVFEMV